MGLFFFLPSLLDHCSSQKNKRNLNMVHQTSTARGDLALLPSKEALAKAFVGKPLTSLRTPAAIVDVAKVRDNCARMHKISLDWGALFRAHVKTHKVGKVE